MAMRKLLGWVLCVVANFVSAAMLHAAEPAEPAVVPPWTTSLDDHPAGSYRYTVNGWEDTSQWRLAIEEPDDSFIDVFHPLVLTLLVVGLSSWLAVLASDDESLAAFWKESERTNAAKPSAKCH